MVVFRFLFVFSLLRVAIAEVDSANVEATGLLQSTRIYSVVSHGDLISETPIQNDKSPQQKVMEVGKVDPWINSPMDEDEDTLKSVEVDENNSDDDDDDDDDDDEMEPDYASMDVDELVQIYDWKYGHLNELLEPPSPSNQSTFTMSIPAAVARSKDPTAFIMAELDHSELFQYNFSGMEINCPETAEMQSGSSACSATIARKPHDLVLAEFLNEATRRKKNLKQKQWASKMIARMSKEVCARNSRALRHAVPNGMSCPSGTNYIPLVHVCRGCDGWQEGAGQCFEPCTDGNGLPHLPDDCIHLYCAADAGTCAAKVTKIAMAFADVISSFVPGAQAMKAVKMAVKSGSRLAAKKIFLVLIRKSARRMLKKLQRKQMKKRLKKYMRKELKKRLKELRKEAQEDETADAILEGGAANLIAQVEAQANPELKTIALDVAEAVDPTGIVSFITAFTAESCNDARVGEDMPGEGLEAERVHWKGVGDANLCSHQRGHQCPETYCYADTDCASRKCHMVPRLGSRGVCAASDGYLTIRSPCHDGPQCASGNCVRQGSISFCQHPDVVAGYRMAKNNHPDPYCWGVWGDPHFGTELKNAVPKSCPYRSANCAITDASVCAQECDKHSACNSFLMSRTVWNSAKDDTNLLNSCALCHMDGKSRRYHENVDTFYKP